MQKALSTPIVDKAWTRPRPVHTSRVQTSSHRYAALLQRVAVALTHARQAYASGWAHHPTRVMHASQRVAMRMGCMASWTDESVLQRPPSEDRGCHRERYAQGPGGPHFRGRDLHRQALRHQSPKRRAAGTG